MKNEETTFGVKPICCRPAGWLFAFHRAYGDYRSHGDYMADEELAAARRGGVLLLIGRVVVLGYIGLISPISPICLINPHKLKWPATGGGNKINAARGFF